MMIVIITNDNNSASHIVCVGEFLYENPVGEFLSGEYFGEFLVENPVGEFLSDRGEFLSGEILSGEFLSGEILAVRVFVRTPGELCV